MLFIYNNTDKKLVLKSDLASEEGKEVNLNLYMVADEEVTESNPNPITPLTKLLSTKSERILDAIKSRYAHGVTITKNPDRQFIIIRSTDDFKKPRSVYDVNNSELDCYDASKEEEKDAYKDYAKSMIFLVVTSDTKLFYKKTLFFKEAEVIKEEGDIKVYRLCPKRGFWKDIKSPMTIRVSKQEEHKLLLMTTEVLKNKKGIENVMNTITETNYVPRNNADRKPKMDKTKSFHKDKRSTNNYCNDKSSFKHGNSSNRSNKSSNRRGGYGSSYGNR